MFEVGDEVISDYFGEGKVVEVNTKLDYPVWVRFIKSSSLEGFTEYGLYRKSNKDTDKDYKITLSTKKMEYLVLEYNDFLKQLNPPIQRRKQLWTYT